MSNPDGANNKGKGRETADASPVDRFFERPILNSPYEYPAQHWELDSSGQPTQKILNYRRPASFVSPIPKPKQQKTKKEPTVEQVGLVLDEGKGLSTEEQQYLSAIINRVRERVDEWRRIPNAADWRVTPETARLLRHWRSHRFSQHPSVFFVRSRRWRRPSGSRRSRHCGRPGENSSNT